MPNFYFFLSQAHSSHPHTISCDSYGQQNLVYLSAAASSGQFDPNVIESTYYSTYKAGGIADAQKWYFDASTKEFVANVNQGLHWPNCGGNDNQADAIAHAVQVVALYANTTTPSSKLYSVIDTVTRVTQNTDEACAFAVASSRILEKLLNNSTLSGLQAVRQTIQDMRARPLYPKQDPALADGLEKVLGMLNVPNIQVCLQIGQSCDYPFNLWTGAHLIAQLIPEGLMSPTQAVAAYENAVRQTIRAGGDSGSRSIFVGSALAIRIGSKNQLPSTWTSKTSVYGKAQDLAAQLVAHRK